MPEDTAGIHRQPYGGPKRKLLLAFDVGTTYSGISYSLLDPGQVPEVKPVTKFPAQEYISGASKIPTIIWYDRTGKVRAVGAEAMEDGICETAEEENWVKAEWFKLHLRSRVGAGENLSNNLPPLPLNKTVIDVFADFLKYLLKCAEIYIVETQANGSGFWKSIEKEIDFVLSHPNGWEGTQQAQMRRAAIQAQLVPDTPEGQSRLTFVTEGEASLHFAIQHGLPVGAMKNGEGIVIVDAGGGTIDISSYSKTVNVSGESYEEVAAPQCHFHGSVFVNIHAQAYLETLLADSPFREDIKDIIRCFDKTTKLRFRSDGEPQYIKFGTVRDNDATNNIRFGQLKLHGADVAMFFQPSVECIVKAVEEQCVMSHKPIMHVVLVGGFAASSWLLTKVQSALAGRGLNLMRPDNHVSKAVSDGAISFYLDHFVRTRVSKMVYGCRADPHYDPSSPEHKARAHKAYVSTSGYMRLRDYFDIILPKNIQVSETKEFRRTYWLEGLDRNTIMQASFQLSCYRGLNLEPKWTDVETDSYTTLCTIDVDLSEVSFTRIPLPGGGRTYFRFEYDIVLFFGLTELKALVAWKEGTIEKRSNAKIVYDPDAGMANK